MSIKVRKPRIALTIIGVLMIMIGLFWHIGNKFYQQYNDSESLCAHDEITTAIADMIPPAYKSYGFKVKMTTNEKVQIYFSSIDQRFQYDSICGYVATGFLIDFKKQYPQYDQAIKNYSFTFLAGSEPMFTSIFLNDVNSSDEVLLSLMKADISTEPKTYQQYLSEKEELFPEETTIYEGDTASYAITDKWSGLIIEPKTEAAKIRNADSTLMQYEHDYYARYFVINNIELTSSQSNMIAYVNFNFKNTSNINYTSIMVYYDMIDSNGHVVMNGYTLYTSTLSPGQIYYEDDYIYINGHDFPTDEPLVCQITSITITTDVGHQYFFQFH